jgi:hypothetical protein
MAFMPESKPQPAATNTITHFILLPLFLIMFGFAIDATARHLAYNPGWNFWLILLSAGLFLLNFQSRIYALRNQDRIIRLEERLRLATLLPPPEFARSADLSTGQLIALRVAADAEIPSLVARTLSENLTPKQIKASIGSWRYDLHRV